MIHFSKNVLFYLVFVVFSHRYIKSAASAENNCFYPDFQQCLNDCSKVEPSERLIILYQLWPTLMITKTALLSVHGDFDPARKLKADCLLSIISGYDKLYKETLPIVKDQITHQVNFKELPFFGQSE